MKKIVCKLFLFFFLIATAQDKVKTKQQNPFYASFASSNVRFEKDIKPTVSEINTW